MKKIIAVVVFLLLGYSNFAQDKKSKELLREVTSKIKSYKNISIDFKYSLNNTKENINQESKGNVTIEGEKYVLNLMGVTKIFDGKKSYTINPEDEEVTVSTANDDDEKPLTPSKMLTFFNKGYKPNWDVVQTIKGRKIQFIKLIPTSAKDKQKEVLLGIDVISKTISRLLRSAYFAVPISSSRP